MVNSKTYPCEVEMPFFVGYNAAYDGIGKARIREFDEHTVTLSVCGDDGEWEEFFTMSKKDFNHNMEFLKRVVAEMGIQ